MSTPTLRQLEIFAQMVASGSVVDCANMLGVSPASIEGDLRALEERLGHQLFIFDGASTTLTAAGHKVAEAMALLSAAEPDDWNDVNVPEPQDGAPEPAEADPVALEVQQHDPAAAVEETEEDSYRPSPPVEPERLTAILPSTEDRDPPDDPVADVPAEIKAWPAKTIAWTSIAAGESGEPEPPIEEPSVESPEVEIAAAAAGVESGVQMIGSLPEPDDEPLELTEIAPDPVEEAVEPALSQRPRIAFGFDEKPASRPVDEPVAQERAEQPVKKVVRLPHALAARVVFAAQAPATFPQPTVVSLFAERPLPVPANDPEPFQPTAPPPVLELQGVAQQQVVVAAHPSVFGHFQEALTAFEQANPDVSITLELDAFTAMRAEPLLAAGRVDIVYYYAMGERERFESRYVWSESLSIFIGADHPLAQQDSVTVEDLIRVRPLLLGSRNGLRPILDNAMRRGGIDLWQPAMETDNLFDIMTAVREGAGYFAAFGPLARDFGKMDGIKRLPFVDPLPPIEVRQVVREEMRDDPVVASLAEYLFR